MTSTKYHRPTSLQSRNLALHFRHRIHGVLFVFVFHKSCALRSYTTLSILDRLPIQQTAASNLFFQAITSTSFHHTWGNEVDTSLPYPSCWLSSATRVVIILFTVSSHSSLSITYPYQSPPSTIFSHGVTELVSFGMV
jgi:hypothetical protein